MDELRFTTLGVIKDPERLQLLFDLFCEILMQLCQVGSATMDDPGVEL